MAFLHGNEVLGGGLCDETRVCVCDKRYGCSLSFINLLSSFRSVMGIDIACR